MKTTEIHPIRRARAVAFIDSIARKHLIRLSSMQHDDNELSSPSVQELRELGVETCGSDSSTPNVDALARFKLVPNHALFIYTSEDSLIVSYIRDHWDALNGLTGNICDIYVSVLQLAGGEDFYSQMDDINSIGGIPLIRPSDLPAIHLWSSEAFCTISLKTLGTEAEVRDCFRVLFEAVRNINGPVTNGDIETLRHSAQKSNNDRASSFGNQGVENTTVGRDLIQILYSSNPKSMETSMDSRNSSSPSGQTITDAKSGGDIKQTSDANENQTIQRVEANGSISQGKTQKSGLSLIGLGKGTGYGVLALVVVALSVLLYYYLRH